MSGEKYMEETLSKDGRIHGVLGHWEVYDRVGNLAH